MKWTLTNRSGTHEIASAHDHAGIRLAVETTFAEYPGYRRVGLRVERNGKWWENADWDREQQLVVYTYTQRVRS